MKTQHYDAFVNPQETEIWSRAFIEEITQTSGVDFQPNTWYDFTNGSGEKIKLRLTNSDKAEAVLTEINRKYNEKRV